MPGLPTNVAFSVSVKLPSSLMSSSSLCVGLGEALLLDLLAEVAAFFVLLLLELAVVAIDMLESAPGE